VIINGKIVEELPSSYTKDALQKCIGCGVIDPFAVSGTIIKDKRGGSKLEHGLSPIKVSGILESFDRSYPIVVGGQPTVEVKRYSYLVKVQGLICTECQGDYRTVEFQGKHINVVQTDSSVVGKSLPVERVLRVEPGDSESSTRSKVPFRPSHSFESKQDNQWLNVGRRKSRG
jgi:hypothetical protein